MRRSRLYLTDTWTGDIYQLSPRKGFLKVKDGQKKQDGHKKRSRYVLKVGDRRLPLQSIPRLLAAWIDNVANRKGHQMQKKVAIIEIEVFEPILGARKSKIALVWNSTSNEWRWHSNLRSVYNPEQIFPTLKITRKVLFKAS